MAKATATKKRFTTFNFMNNGDIHGIDSESAMHYLGRCDSDGDISIDLDEVGIETDQEQLMLGINECLVDTVRSAIAGDIDWTPDECWLKASGLRDDYQWDGKKWVAA